VIDDTSDLNDRPAAHTVGRFSFTGDSHVALSKSNESAAAMERSRKLKGVFAGCVIVASLVFVVWSAWPKKEPYVAPLEDPVANWVKAYGELSSQHSKTSDPFYWATSGIVVKPNADRSGLVVTGKTKSQAELALVKAELAKVQPTLPIEWQVTIGQ
jgi:hypothetical protein